MNFSSSQAVNLFARVEIFAPVYLLVKALPHFNAPANHTFPIAPIPTDSGVISPFVPISYFAPARPHSRAISPIFAVVASFLPAPSAFAHDLSMPTLFGQIIEPPMSVTNSPTFALVLSGS